MTKGSTIGSVPRKRLADISNLQQRPKPSNQDVKPQQNISLTTKEYIDKLHKENMTLMKVLADRNKIIELSGIELQKLRISLQKVQQQNLQLAQANSQMLAELNSGKDRLKALQHELGCKNGLLKARKLVLEEEAKTVTCQVFGNEVGTTKSNEAGESLLADKEDNKPCNTNRRQQSKNKSLGPSTVKPVQAKEKIDNRRRRQSARFKSEEPEPTEDLFEIDDDKLPVSSTVKPVQAKEKVANKRRRQSAKFKSEEPEPTEDLFEIDDDKFPVSPLCDELAHNNSPTSSNLSVQTEHEMANSVPIDEAQAFRRTSVGRPLRRAVEKIQSYKEIPINVKMRRAQFNRRA